jgi:hypothetical protein
LGEQIKIYVWGTCLPISWISAVVHFFAQQYAYRLDVKSVKMMEWAGWIQPVPFGLHDTCSLGWSTHAMGNGLCNVCYAMLVAPRDLFADHGEWPLCITGLSNNV